MKKFWEDFKKFISRGNVIDMAVGVAVASAFTAIVTAFTKGFVSPLIAVITGGFSLSDLKYVYREAVLDPETGAVTSPEVAFLWGEFVQKIVDFLIIALVLFTVMRIASAISAHSAKIRDALNAKKLEEEAAAAAEAEAQAKAEAEAQAQAEAEAKAKAEAEAQAVVEAEKARLERQEQLLTEIRDLLRNK